MQVVEYFHAREIFDLKNNPNDYKKLRNDLIDQALPLNYLISDAFEAGDYPTLVTALRRSLHIQSEFEKTKADPRDFHEHVEKYIAKLNESEETLNKLKSGFDRGLMSLSAGIGIDFEKEPNAAGIKISGVRSDMPASQAGIAVGDLIVAIDGVLVANMNPEKSSISLMGDAGSTVSIEILRDGQYRELKLVRKPLINMSSEQREEFIKSLSAIRDHLTDTIDYYHTEANKLNQLSKETDMSVAFKKLIDIIEKHNNSLKDQSNTAITLAERCLSKSSLALSLFQRFVSLQNVMIRDRKLNDENTALMLKLDQEEEAFEKNPDISEIDKGSLGLSMITVGTFNNMRENAHSRLKLVKQVVDSFYQSPDAVKTASIIAGLASRLDNWRSRMVTDAAKIESLHLGQNFYADYVQVLVDMHLPEPALQASEAARARAFADLLARSHGTVIPTDAKAPLASLSSTKTMTLDEIRQIVRDTGITVVEYFVLKDELLTWIINPPKPDSKEVDIHLFKTQIGQQALKDKVAKLVTTLEPLPNLSALDDMKIQEAMRANEKKMTSELKSLYDILIAPIEHLLPEKNPDQVVTIIPHDSLFRIPFAALARSIKDDKIDHYLVEDHALTYVPSLAVLNLSRQMKRESVTSSSLLAVIKPALGKNELGKRFESLPTVEEINKSTVNFYNSKSTLVLSGLEATQSKLFSEAPSRDVILFYTHAKAIEEDSLNSYIALTNGLLTAETISKQHLNAKLVILAACETGRGKITGDGVQGLARMFMVSGAKAVMVSLWSVSQEATLELMNAFHQALKNEGHGLAASLRQAQIQLFKKEGYPEVPMWAGFIIIGDEQ